MQKIGRSPRGWKGTCVCLPHREHVAGYNVRCSIGRGAAEYPVPLPASCARLAARQLGQRLGGLVSPRLAKNSCSPCVKTKLAPQSRHTRVLSIIRLVLSPYPACTAQPTSHGCQCGLDAIIQRFGQCRTATEISRASGATPSHLGRQSRRRADGIHGSAVATPCGAGRLHHNAPWARVYSWPPNTSSVTPRVALRAIPWPGAAASSDENWPSRFDPEQGVQGRLRR